MTVHWEHWERKVLDTFLDGERLVRIPAKRKKRDVVLRVTAGCTEHVETRSGES